MIYSRYVGLPGTDKFSTLWPQHLHQDVLSGTSGKMIQLSRWVSRVVLSCCFGICLMSFWQRCKLSTQVSDSTSRSRWKCVAWHPEVATQMALASEDDHTPVIQIWDLRQASSPMKQLEGHASMRMPVATQWSPHPPLPWHVPQQIWSSSTMSATSGGTKWRKE